MKKLVSIYLIFTGLHFTNAIIAQEVSRKVQVAILFDTSNSMDGLIDQAKTRIWGIVNEINSLRYQGEVPKLEIAIYEYGKSSLSVKNHYVLRLLNLTNDLDEVSKQLFSLRTNGGDEFCGAVIKHSLDELAWSIDPSDLKMIFIAGNEPFTQGPIRYQEVCADAKKRGIFINTIYCGQYDQGVSESWRDGATCSNGSYFNINSDAKIVTIPTPYDERINSYNDSLNRTYYGYGKLGESKKVTQSAEDSNAEVQSIASKMERTKAKASSNYSNSSWDIVDAVNQKEVDILKLKDEELPAELKGKTEAEKLKFIDETNAERKKYKTEIVNLSGERQKYIDEEMAKREKEGMNADDFGTKVNESVVKTALGLGYERK
jgi:hypothetical protein